MNRTVAARKMLLMWIGLAVAASATWSPSSAVADDPPPARPAQPGSIDKLAFEEQRIADKYRRLEDILLRMAELGAATDPRRAALLKKAVAQSKDQLIAVRLEEIVELLGKDQLSKAMEGQTEVGRDLRELLNLLMSENRAKRIESEKARIREYLKRINGLIKLEKDLQGRTAGRGDPQRLAREQGNVAEKTGELADDVQNNEERKAEGEKGDGGGSSPSQADRAEASPQKRLEAARQRMKEAEKKLQQAQRQGAVEQQEEAIRELQLAKSKLEEILRQLREEEIGRVLTMLEARFRQMLQMQEEVYEGTIRLDKAISVRRTHEHEIEAGRLSGRESEIVVEIDKALLLLRDDGSAAAFMEAAEQMRDDMRQVVERLAQAKVGQMTQSVEEDILSALKEMVEALQKAQKDQQSRKNPSGAPPPGQMQEPPLVDMLAELKMIRALQMRVNKRTARYAKLIDGEQAGSAELVEAIRRLAERQERIYRVTHDLETGKNR